MAIKKFQTWLLIWDGKRKNSLLSSCPGRGLHLSRTAVEYEPGLAVALLQYAEYQSRASNVSVSRPHAHLPHGGEAHLMKLPEVSVPRIKKVSSRINFKRTCEKWVQFKTLTW